MTELEKLEQWWDGAYGGTMPTRERVLELVLQGSVDPGTGGFLYVRLGELEGTP